MKLLYYTPFYYPNYSYQENYLPGYLKENGYNICILTSCLDTRGNTNFKREQFIDNGVQVYRKGFYKLYDSKFILKEFKNFIVEKKPDLILSVGGVFDFNLWHISKLKDKLNFKLFCESHMHMSVIANNTKFENFARNIFKKVFIKEIKNNADKFIAYSNETKLFLKKVYNISEDKIIIIPIGINTKNFYYDTSIRKKTRSELKIKDQEILIIYAGKINQKKNPFLLLKAFNLLVNNYPLKLLLVGDADREYLLKMKRFISENNIDNKVIFIPRVQNHLLYKYYNAADIGVWPSQESLTMLEAASCGLPIIAKDTDFIRERIGYKNGLVYKENDLIELKEKIERLINDNDLRKKMGKQGIKLVEDKFSWEKIVEHYIHILNLSN